MKFDITVIHRPCCHGENLAYFKVVRHLLDEPVDNPQPVVCLECEACGTRIEMFTLFDSDQRNK